MELAKKFLMPARHQRLSSMPNLSGTYERSILTSLKRGISLSSPSPSPMLKTIVFQASVIICHCAWEYVKHFSPRHWKADVMMKIQPARDILCT